MKMQLKNRATLCVLFRLYVWQMKTNPHIKLTYIDYILLNSRPYYKLTSYLSA